MQRIVLFDTNNLAHRLLHLKEVGAVTGKPNWDLWHYMMFDSVLGFVRRMPTVDEVVLAVDHGESWRKLAFPPYKENRKGKRDERIPWDEFHKWYEEWQVDMAMHTPFRVIRQDQAEADDVIGVLALHHAKAGNQATIVSRDEDYLQLLDLPNVMIFEPTKREYRRFPCEIKVSGRPVTITSSQMYLDLRSMCGQPKDNIYNCKTPTDWRPTEGQKKKPSFGPLLALKMFEDTHWTYLLDEDGLIGDFNRNAQLMDFRKIPGPVRDAILNHPMFGVQAAPEAFHELVRKRCWGGVENRIGEVMATLGPLYRG